VVLAPAAGLGVDRMARMFSSDNPSPRARPLFTAAVLVVLWVFGVHEVRTLRRHGWGGPPPQAASAVRTARGEAP
jgi:hypothetical protein